MVNYLKKNILINESDSIRPIDVYKKIINEKIKEINDNNIVNKMENDIITSSYIIFILSIILILRFKYILN